LKKRYVFFTRVEDEAKGSELIIISRRFENAEIYVRFQTSPLPV